MNREPWSRQSTRADDEWPRGGRGGGREQGPDTAICYSAVTHVFLMTAPLTQDWFFTFLEARVPPIYIYIILLYLIYIYIKLLGSEQTHFTVEM